MMICDRCDGRDDVVRCAVPTSVGRGNIPVLTAPHDLCRCCRESFTSTTVEWALPLPQVMVKKDS